MVAHTKKVAFALLHTRKSNCRTWHRCGSSGIVLVPSLKTQRCRQSTSVVQ
jgi:hypothetical protein